MTAKTGAQRVTDSKARKIAAGMREVRSLWAHPDDHAAIREAAAKLARKRAQPGTRAGVIEAALLKAHKIKPKE